MQVPVYNKEGDIIEAVEVKDSLFGVPFNQGLVHQAMVRQLANARQGTASTKTRGKVAGSTAKLFRQKGTGRARQGSIRAPHRRGGGIVFGPHPRSYRMAMPKKMRQLALKCVLSAKRAEDELILVDDLSLSQPGTKDMMNVLARLGVNGSALVVTAAPEMNVVKSARNIPGIKTLPVATLNVLDMLSHRQLVMTVPAVRQAEAIWAG